MARSAVLLSLPLFAELARSHIVVILRLRVTDFQRLLLAGAVDLNTASINVIFVPHSIEMFLLFSVPGGDLRFAPNAW